jgi:hypothetical protein
MRRRVYRLLVAMVLSLIPAVLGTVVAVLYSESGNRVLGRLAGPELTRMFRGQFEVGRVTGSFVHSLVLEDVVIRDTLGEPFATVPRLSVSFALPNLLAGRFVFDEAELIEPDIRIVKRRSGRLSHQEVFRLGEGPGGGRPALVEFRNVRIRRGTSKSGCHGIRPTRPGPPRRWRRPWRPTVRDPGGSCWRRSTDSAGSSSSIP